MKKIYLLIVIVGMSIGGYCQQGEWTWMNGDSAVNSIGHYGTQGVFDSLNSPPALYEAAEWTDANGNFWLFGGSNWHCDLWKFKPSINQWAWIKGSGLIGSPGIYGTKNIPSSTNNPGGRYLGIASWIDLNGNLWLMGGYGYDKYGNPGSLNDLWKYNISTNEWTWMAGSDSVFKSGNYGTIMVTSSTNNPPAKWETNASWVDDFGNLWYYGGGNVGFCSDLWKYDVSINQWIWINGADTANQLPVYGIKGVSNVSNTPGGRWIYSKWKDNNGNFWLFAGMGYDSLGNYHCRNDLWRYNPLTNEWTWIDGPPILNNSGTLGTQCIPDTINNPSARFENRAVWTRSFDNFVTFGGSSDLNFNNKYNDLWNYSVSTNQWTWMSGSSIPNQLGSYGGRTISTPTNSPSSRVGSIGWKDNFGNLWLFGGGWPNCYNDMWRFIPDTNCPPIINFEGISQSTPIPPAISLYPNPNNGTFTLHSQLSILNCQLKVMDVLGRTVYSYSISTSTLNAQLTIPLSDGIYFWEVINDSGIAAKGKLIVMVNR
jgi:hypothetical protein